MPSTTVITLVGLVLAVALIAVLIKFMNRDKIDAIVRKRKAGCLLANAADFVEAHEHIAVCLAIDKSKLYYENAEIQAYLELRQIEEVEYDDELATGGHVHGGVLRLRSHGKTFEFTMSEADFKKWHNVLPAHRADEPGDVHVEPVGAGAAT